MKRAKKQNSAKKIVTIICIMVLLLSIVGIFRVCAKEENFTITKIDVSEKSATVDVKELNFEKSEINSDVVYHKVGDYITYKITIKNNDSTSYKIIDVSDNNVNSFISYDYSDFKDKEIKANETTELYVTVKYLKELDDVTKREQEMDVDIKISLEDEKGKIVTEEVKINSNNPKTGDSITPYVSGIIISAAVLVFIAGKKNKKRNNRRKKFLGVLIAVAVLTPSVTRAAGNALTFNFKSTFVLNDKLVLTYTNVSGEEETFVVGYGKTIPVPDELEKTGYNFLGWYDENGEKVEGEIKNFKEDLKLTPKFELITYDISYELDGGEADTTSTYTIESGDITLPKPEKAGYTFVGWTGSNGKVPQKEVTIKKGSYGDKEYTANWETINYTLSYNLNGGLLETENPLTYTIESKDITINNPKKFGYTFTGWTGTELDDKTETL